MLLKLLACNVFTREACLAVAASPHTIDLEFTELGEHSSPSLLRERLHDFVDNDQSIRQDARNPLAAHVYPFGVSLKASSQVHEIGAAHMQHRRNESSLF